MESITLIPIVLRNINTIQFVAIFLKAFSFSVKQFDKLNKMFSLRDGCVSTSYLSFTMNRTIFNVRLSLKFVLVTCYIMCFKHFSKLKNNSHSLKLIPLL